MALEVAHGAAPAAIDTVVDAAEAAGGYLVGQTRLGVQIRVPSRNFRKVMRSIGSLGDVTDRGVSAQDVSEEYHDLGVQLRNLQTVRTRLEQLMVKTKNVDEALRVGQQLNNVGSQIDRIKGRMKFLRTRAQFSLISVTFSVRPKVQKEKVVVKRKTPPPSPRRLRLPVPWLDKAGIDRLLDLDD